MKRTQREYHQWSALLGDNRWHFANFKCKHYKLLALVPSLARCVTLLRGYGNAGA